MEKGLVNMNHCALLQSGEIQAVIGDDSRNGLGGKQYCGVWSLTSKHRPFNAFGNSYAGLIPGEMRSKTPQIKSHTGSSCILERNADEKYPVSSRAGYSVSGPYYLDHVFSFTDSADVRQKDCPFREVSWCSYINCPADLCMHFLSDGEWYAYNSPSHGVEASLAPSYIMENDIETWPVQSDWRRKPLMDRPFYWDWHKRRFDLPFYYGRLDNMVLVLVFDKPQWLRFFCSPSGGGASMLPGKTCPAWDFMWIIPESCYHPGREYSFRMRMIYKPFISNEDVMAEYENTVNELGFDKPANT